MKFQFTLTITGLGPIDSRNALTGFKDQVEGFGGKIEVTNIPVWEEFSIDFECLVTGLERVNVEELLDGLVLHIDELYGQVGGGFVEVLDDPDN